MHKCHVKNAKKWRAFYTPVRIVRMSIGNRYSGLGSKRPYITTDWTRLSLRLFHCPAVFPMEMYENNRSNGGRGWQALRSPVLTLVHSSFFFFISFWKKFEQVSRWIDCCKKQKRMSSFFVQHMSQRLRSLFIKKYLAYYLNNNDRDRVIQ